MYRCRFVTVSPRVAIGVHAPQPVVRHGLGIRTSCRRSGERRAASSSSPQKRRAQGANYPGPFSLVCSRLSLIGLSFPRRASSCESEINAPGDALFQKELVMRETRGARVKPRGVMPRGCLLVSNGTTKKPSALGIRAFRNHSRFRLNAAGLPRALRSSRSFFHIASPAPRTILRALGPSECAVH